MKKSTKEIIMHGIWIALVSIVVLSMILILLAPLFQ